MKDLVLRAKLILAGPTRETALEVIRRYHPDAHLVKIPNIPGEIAIDGQGDNVGSFLGGPQPSLVLAIPFPHECVGEPGIEVLRASLEE